MQPNHFIFVCNIKGIWTVQKYSERENTRVWYLQSHQVPVIAVNSTNHLNVPVLSTGQKVMGLKHVFNVLPHKNWD